MKNEPEFVSLTPMVPAGKDLAKTLEFYTHKLGFALAWQAGGMAGIRRGTVMLNLIENDNRVWIENSSFSIDVTDLDALYEEYQSQSVEIGLLEMKSWGRREFHLIDPTGVCLQFYQVEE